MAASSKQPAGFKDTLSIGSAEDFDICCYPCLTDDHCSEAKAFCLTCQENLCKRCIDAHRRLKVSKDHMVEDKPRKFVATTSSPHYPHQAYTQSCTIHKNEVIKFFCRQHNYLGCNDCMTLKHRTCDIDYIPDVCVGITTSEEYNETVRDVTEKIQKRQEFEQRINTSLTGSKASIEKVLNEIEEFQNKLNFKIKTMKKTLVQQLKSQETNDHRQADEVLSTNQTVLSDLKTLQKALQSSETSGQNGQEAEAYITMKRAQSCLKALGCQKDICKAETRTYNFVRSAALEEFLLPVNCFGKISSSNHIISVEVILKNLKNVKVRTSTDEETCTITGCAILSHVQLLLADWSNNKVKILDVEKESIVDESSMPSFPSDVAVLSQEQAAVVLPFDCEILILSTTKKMAAIRSIKINRSCVAIACCQDLLYVLCQRPNIVELLDMQGNNKYSISLESAFTGKQLARYICLNTNAIYLCSVDGDMVVSVSLDGELRAVYKNRELNEPLGLTKLGDGSLLVCCGENGTLHHISSDLKYGLVVAEDIQEAQSICYEHSDKRFYVGRRNDCLSVLKLSE